MAFHVPEKFRIQGSSQMGNNGAFVIKSAALKNPLRVVASDGEGWEHVSVSLPHRCPSWQEMCFIKDMFWDDEDTVIQFHPPKSEYVNCHPYCLHLWRQIYADQPLPPSILVGPK